MNHDKWLRHFAQNHLDRVEPDWKAPMTVPPAAFALLVRSLEQYQLGDGGGPARLIAGDAEQFRGSTEQMRLIVDAWFAEEREHARLLGGLLDRFGGHRIRGHWSFSAFLKVRRALGVRFELQVLLLVEIVSMVYYRLLRRHCADAALRDVCSLVLRDEAAHIAFHRDRLASAGVSCWGVGGTLWETQFRLFGLGAALMLWLNHGRCLKALGARPLEFWREIHRELSRFLWRLSRTATAPAQTSLQTATA
ncbi:MAG: ferritin-like domain-containing protein [Verrucomicrobia bacterium]|nr:ferritin-like domain-containing protein [Verrucomicrobiota bacterium]